MLALAWLAVTRAALADDDDDQLNACKIAKCAWFLGRTWTDHPSTALLIASKPVGVPAVHSLHDADSPS
jgi:hypothetical protein